MGGFVGGWVCRWVGGGLAEMSASEPDGQTGGGARWQTWAAGSHEGEGPPATTAMDKSIFQSPVTMS